MQRANLSHGGGATNGRHNAAVEIVERPARLPLDRAPDICSDRIALLDGHGRNTWQHLTVWLSRGRQVADYEDLRMSRNAQVGLNGNATAAIHLDTQLAAKW